MQPTGDHRQNTTTPHVRVPSELIYSAVSPRARDLWTVLDDLARAHPAVTVSVATLAATLGVGERQLQRLARELEQAGWLDLVGTGGRGRARDWYPRRRARAVHNAVDNRPERVTSVSPIPGVKGDTNVTLYRGPSIGTAREKAQAGCARCELGWVEDDAGRVTRCACARPPSPF